MSMVKIVSPAGWDFDRPAAQLLKVARDGLKGSDRADFIKVAGHAFADIIDNVKLAKDEVPVHLIALGADERWGPNRNMDSFRYDACTKYHDTFVKHARFFRNHANTRTERSYGVIKASAYNPDMHRVELLVALNGSKEAAEHNKGLVADKELEKLERGEDLGVSMAARVPRDVCSSCGHSSRTRADYCDETACIGPLGEKRGGCKHHLGSIGADGHILHVDNPDPDWFDISHVIRPADRIAYGSRADYLQKAASAEEFIPGAQLAELLGVQVPTRVLLDAGELTHSNPVISGQLKLAAALAIYEQRLELPAELYRGLDAQVSAPLTRSQLDMLGRPGTEKAASSVSALADAGIILPLRDFANWSGGTDADKAAEYLPDIYERLLGHGDLAQRIATNTWACGHTKSGAAALLANTLADDFALTEDAVTERAMKSAIRELPVPSPLKWNDEKTAADDAPAVRLAEEYALYKLAALFRMAGQCPREFELTTGLALGQNRLR
jgi:hypothetical protein